MGCAMGVHMLVPNSPYEIQCASVGSAQTIPMSDHPITMTTKSAPIQMASIQASSMDSVTMHVTTKGSTDILCALFRELDSHNNGTSGVESTTDPSYKADNQPVLKAPGSSSIKQWMVHHAVYQSRRHCDSSSGCFITVSSLQPGTSYKAACLPAGGGDDDVAPLYGSHVTTWAPLP